MKEYVIRLKSVEEVRDFNKAICSIEGNFDLQSDRYVIDAKSILGIFSLNLNKKLRLTAHESKPEIIEALERKIQPFIA